MPKSEGRGLRAGEQASSDIASPTGGISRGSVFGSAQRKQLLNVLNSTTQQCVDKYRGYDILFRSKRTLAIGVSVLSLFSSRETSCLAVPHLCCNAAEHCPVLHFFHLSGHFRVSTSS